VDLGGTVELRSREHTFREFEKDDELVLLGEAAVRPTRGLRMSGSFQMGDRKPKDPLLIEDYEDVNGAFFEQPNLRRLDVGQRSQMKARGQLAWMPVEMFDFSATYDHTENDFLKDSTSAENALMASYGPQLGLRMQKGDNVIATASLRPADALDMTVGYGYGKTDSEMFSRETPTAPPPLRQDDSLTWRLGWTDYNSLAFGSATWWAVPKKVSVGVNYEFDASRITHDMHKAWERRVVGGVGMLFPLADTIDVPTITYRRHDLQVQVMVYATHDTDVGLRYGRQIYRASDFSAANTPIVEASSPQGLAGTGIYLGDRILNFNGNTAALVVTRRF
jgi:hypothetical protein